MMKLGHIRVRLGKELGQAKNEELVYVENCAKNEFIMKIVVCYS